MSNKKNNNNDLVNSVAMFVTFLTLSWIVFLFPKIIGNSPNILIAKILLIMGILFISTFGDEKSKAFYSNFGVGLSFIVICLAFFQNLPNTWYYRLPFFLFFAVFGFYGVYQSIIFKIQEVCIKKVDVSNVENKSYRINFQSLFQVILYIVEFLAALVTILQFIGFKLE